MEFNAAFPEKKAQAGLMSFSRPSQTTFLSFTIRRSLASNWELSEDSVTLTLQFTYFTCGFSFFFSFSFFFFFALFFFLVPISCLKYEKSDNLPFEIPYKCDLITFRASGDYFRNAFPRQQ